MRILYFISDVMFFLVYYLVGYRKKTVYENLNLCFPEKSKKEITTIAKKFYHHFCDIIIESIKSLSISEKELRKRFVPTNIELVKAIEKENKSVTLMMGHYASWEWIFILQRYTSLKGFAIYKRLENKYFDALVKRIRAKYNTFLITTKEAISVMMRAKLNGELTLNGFVGDQTPKLHKSMHWNKFMGITVPFHTGGEFMAKRLDTPVIFCKVSKVKRGYYEATFKTITLTPREYENYDITDIFMKLVEDQIREAPEHYLWTHKRWKHRNSVPEDYR